MPEYLTAGYVRCVCHHSISLRDAARDGAFGRCPYCGLLFDWPRRLVESATAQRRRRRREIEQNQRRLF